MNVTGKSNGAPVLTPSADTNCAITLRLSSAAAAAAACWRRLGRGGAFSISPSSEPSSSAARRLLLPPFFFILRFLCAHVSGSLRLVGSSHWLVVREPLPPIAEVNAKSDAEAVAVLRVLFEAAPVLEHHIVSLRPWASYEDVIDRSQAFVEELLRQNRTANVLSVVNAHPAIGADSAKLSADSKIEQGAAGDPKVLARLAELNKVYESKFGFRFVLFVNGRPKDAVLTVLESRLKNSPREEMQTAAQAMMDIARDRLRKRKLMQKL